MFRYMFLLCVILPSIAHSQHLENKVFEDICNYLVKQNEFYSLRPHLDSVSLSTNPINNEKRISYGNKKDSYVKQFRRYSKDEQANILSGYLIPSLPLTDSIVIVDSIGFFPFILAYKKDSFNFEIAKNSNLIFHKTAISICHVGIQEKEVVITLAFQNKRYRLNCYILPQEKKVTKYKLFRTDTVYID